MEWNIIEQFQSGSEETIKVNEKHGFYFKNLFVSSVCFVIIQSLNFCGIIVTHSQFPFKYPVDVGAPAINYNIYNTIY